MYRYVFMNYSTDYIYIYILIHFTEESIHQLSVSPDSNLVAVADLSYKIAVLGVESKEVVSLYSHSSATIKMAFILQILKTLKAINGV